MVQLLHLPELQMWGQQLANILPLAALLEFVDVEKKLHMLELSGFCPMWNWPLTPVGARLLLSDQDTTDACCLDRDNRVPVLHCMDGKYGDAYPSSAPATLRLIISGTRVHKKITNRGFDSNGSKTRKQLLELFLVQERPAQNHWIRSVGGVYGNASPLYVFVSIFGWSIWVALLFLCAISALYLAIGYLLLMPATAVAVTLRFGSKPRELTSMKQPGNANRFALATNSLNGSEWWAFYGPKIPINGLLNRPLLRGQPPRHDKLGRWLIRLCVVSQWTVAIASCAKQSWDAFAVTLWIAFCAIVMKCLYSSERGAVDWLKYVCGLEIKRVKVPFTSRRSLLGALIRLNPDRETTGWLDPIISKTHEERKLWEAAVYEYIDSRVVNEKHCAEYWYPFVLEGVEMGDKICDLKERIL
ncbi:hypothetical protein BCR34DRAFT_632964 [Clohesyomyces aquaticus]|uniref:Uncharacterized protein n=1 Tax=Clohesyomyces aquaticus TaxID=1231657 RepID=A0A1Y1Z638_9PLEO|nr:hypothetical protein BCR34DRAFT_632964 [Clohesyomyces aquaticus]